MPIETIDKDLPVNIVDSPGFNINPEQEASSFVDVFASSVKRETATGAIYQNLTSDIPRGIFHGTGRDIDTSYNPFEYVDSIGRKDVYEHITFANSNEEVDKIIKYIDDQRNDLLTIQNGTWTGIIAGLAAQVVDVPLYLLPGVGVARSLGKGAQVYKSLTAGAISGAGAVVFQEGVLQALQPERTAEETALNIFAGAAIGGVLGGALGALSSDLATVLRTEVKQGVNKKEIEVVLNTETGNLYARRSAGAAESSIDDHELAIINNHVSQILGPLAGPALKGMSSKNPTLQKIADDFFNHGFVTEGNLKGRASEALETEIKLDIESDLIPRNDLHRDIYSQYLGQAGTTSEVKTLYRSVRRPTDKLSWTEFKEEIARATRAGGQHENPFIAKAAQADRQIYLKYGKLFQELGILSKEIPEEKLLNYLPRVYNTKAILNDIPGFKVALRNNIRNAKTMSDDELEKLIDDVVDNILHMGNRASELAHLLNKVSGKPRFTKSRVLDLDETDDELAKFLVNDPDELINKYVNSSAHLVRVQNYLQRHNYKNINEVFSEFDANRASQLNKITDSSAREKYIKQSDKDRQLLTDIFRIFTGKIGKEGRFDDAFRYLRKYETLRLLGGVLLSSIPDLAMPIFVHGLPRTITDGYMQLATNTKGWKASNQELKDMLIATELQMNDTFRRIAGVDNDVFNTQSRAGRVMDTTSDIFGRVTGLAYWNQSGKSMAGHLSKQRSMRAILSKNLSDKERTRLAKLGLGRDEIQKVREAYIKAGGFQEKGLYILNVEKWDAESKRLIQQAIKRESENTIITPSKGDIPVFIQESQAAQVIFQFKSFALAATNKILLSGLQRQDAEVLQGLLALIGLGGMSWIIKEKLKGRDVDISLEKFMLEGIARSGVGGYIGDVAFALNPFNKGISSRFAAQSKVDFIFGPSTGLIKDGHRFLTDIFDGDLNRQDAKNLGKLLPFNNLFYLRKALDTAFGEN